MLEIINTRLIFLLIDNVRWVLLMAYMAMMGLGEISTLPVWQYCVQHSVRQIGEHMSIWICSCMDLTLPKILLTLGDQGGKFTSNSVLDWWLLHHGCANNIYVHDICFWSTPKWALFWVWRMEFIPIKKNVAGTSFFSAATWTWKASEWHWKNAQWTKVQLNCWKNDSTFECQFHQPILFVHAGMRLTSLLPANGWI